MIGKDIRLKASVLESHAAQLRAEALEFLYSKGTEYTEVLSEGIGDALHDESEHKRIFAMLAEIGFCAVFAGAVDDGDDPARDPMTGGTIGEND